MNSGALAFSSGVGFIGMALLALGAWRRSRELAPRRWQRVSGTIVASSIAKEYVGHGGYQSVPVIQYEYCWNGQTFKSSHWSPGNYSSGRKAVAEAVVSRYPLGRDVEVFINSKRPVKSVLEFGPTLVSKIFIFSGTIFVALALLPLVLK